MLTQLQNEYWPESILGVIVSTVTGTALEIINGIMNTPDALIDQFMDWLNDPLNPWKTPIVGPIAENIVETTTAFYQNPSVDTFVQMWGAWGEGFLTAVGAYELAKTIPTPKLLLDETGAVGKDIKALRKQGVRDFWKEERSRLEQGKPGSRDWTLEQEADIRAGRVPKDAEGRPIEGHHIDSVEKYPEKATDKRNIKPLTFREHRGRGTGIHSIKRK